MHTVFQLQDNGIFIGQGKNKNKTNKKTIYLRQLKLEGKEGGRPDGISESINNVEVLILGEGDNYYTKHKASQVQVN